MLQGDVMTVGMRTDTTTPTATKRRARKERPILAGTSLKERRARKPKAHNAVHITSELDRYKINKDVRTESGAPSMILATRPRKRCVARRSMIRML